MRARLVLAGLAVTALVLGACGTNVPKLPGPLAATGGAKSEATAASADALMMRPNVKYVLADGVTTDAKTGEAYKFDEVTRTDVEKLAKALGVPGAVRSQGDGWNVGQGAKETASSDAGNLYVSRGGSFSMNASFAGSVGSGCAIAPVAADGTPDAPSANSASASPSSSAVCAAPSFPPPPPTTVPANAPTKAEAQRIATDALKTAGVSVGDAIVTTETVDGSSFDVRIRSRVQGKTVSGFEHFVTVDATKKITTASGYLAGPSSVGTYDLATLQRAVERLNASTPQPYGIGGPERLGAGVATDMATPETAVAPAPGAVTNEPVPVDGGGSIEPTVITLTKVEVGLMLQGDSAGALWLVPAYDFTSDHGDHVFAQAADDKYLEQPTDTTSVKPGSGAGGGSAGSTGGGTADPGSSANCAGLSPSSADANGITAQVCANSTTVKAGESVMFTITGSDPDRAFTDGPCGDGVTENFGDGGPGAVRCQACAATVADGPGKVQRGREHTYAAAGTYTAEFTITSGTMCTKDPKDSTATLSLVMTVT
ncbi:MAG: hypothetical protein QOJ00_883 [Actinomycetota bacterium]